MPSIPAPRFVTPLDSIHGPKKFLSLFDFVYFSFIVLFLYISLRTAALSALTLWHSTDTARIHLDREYVHIISHHALFWFTFCSCHFHAHKRVLRESPRNAL